jgi:hypothetical protein
MGPIAQVVAAVATVAGTVGQYNSQKKAADIQNTQNTLQTRRSAVLAIREAQMKRAAVVNEAQGQGAMGGSAVAGGMSSLGSQLGSGLGFAAQYSNLSRDLSKAQQNADLFGTIAKVGGWGVQKYGLPGSTTDQGQ